MVVTYPTHTTPDRILLSSESKLIADVSDANESVVWISTLPDRPEPPPSGHGYEISMTGGVFDEDEIIGGGRDTLHVMNCQLVVTLHSIFSPLDEASRDKEFLTQESVGILRRVTEVMKSFAGTFLYDLDTGNRITAPMVPTQYVIPPHTEKPSGYASLHFRLEFDWDLT